MIYQLAIVSKCNRAEFERIQERLCIFNRPSTGSRITDMPDGDISLQFFKIWAAENITYETDFLFKSNVAM